MIVSFAFIINVQVKHKIIGDLLTTYLRQYSSSLSFHRICCKKKCLVFSIVLATAMTEILKRWGCQPHEPGAAESPDELIVHSASVGTQ